MKNVVITDRNFNVKVAPNAKFHVKKCRLVRRLVPGGYELATALAVPVQLYAACDLKFPAALNGPQFLSGTYRNKPLIVEDGEIEVPAGAGLGVEIDEVRIKP